MLGLVRMVRMVRTVRMVRMVRMVRLGRRQVARWSLCRSLAHHLQGRAMAVKYLFQRLTKMTGWAEAVANLRLPSEPCVTL
jgi:hypothetical protein